MLTGETIRERIWEARLAAEMTQTDLAEAVSEILGREVSQRVISHAENSTDWGQAILLAAIAEATESSTAFMLRRDE